MKKSIIFMLALTAFASFTNSNALNVNALSNDFSFIKGTVDADYVSSTNNITLKAGGNVVAKSEESYSSLHLQFTSITKEYYANNQYGFIINGSNEGENVTGTLIKPYFNGGGLEVEYGYFTNGQYDYMSRWTCDFGCGVNDKMTWDIYVIDSTVSILINNWVICSFYSLTDEGNVYLYSNSLNTDYYIENISMESISGKIGKYLLREQWLGFNYYVPLVTYKSNHSFTMNIPDDVNLNEITELKLFRLTTSDPACNQNADLYVNDDYVTRLNTTYKDQWYYYDNITDLDPSKLTSKTLKFDVKNLEGEFCVTNYRLAYKTANSDTFIIADSLMYGSTISENAHNVSGIVNWTGDKKGFVEREVDDRTTYIGIEKGKPLYEFKLPSFTKKSDINYTFTTCESQTVNLLDYVEVQQDTCFDYYHEFWIDSNQFSNNLLTLENQNLNARWYVDLFIPVQDLYGGPNVLKYTVDGALNVTKTDGYTLTFDSQGGSEVSAKEYASTEVTVAPENPTKDGYEFAGWYITSDCEDEDLFVFGNNLTCDTVLYAKWIKKVSVDDFIATQLDAQVSFTYSELNQEYTNFGNYSLYFRLQFDKYSSIENAETSGIYISNDLNKLYNGEAYASESTNLDSDYIVELELDNETLTTTFYIAGYLVVNGVTYTTNVQHVTFKDMLKLTAEQSVNDTTRVVCSAAYASLFTLVD